MQVLYHQPEDPADQHFEPLGIDQNLHDRESPILLTGTQLSCRTRSLDLREGPQ